MNYIMSSMFGHEGQGGAVGHQFINYLAGYTLAQRYDLQFVHTPFVGKHTQIQIDVPVENWNKFLDFGQFFVPLEDLPPDIVSVTLPKIHWDQAKWNHQQLKSTIDHHKNNNVLFHCGANQFIVTDWVAYHNNPFKEIYKTARRYDPIESFLVPDKINVAVHIRRGDITTRKYSDRYIPNSIIRRQIDLVRQVFGDKVFFHIHSEKYSAEKTTASAIDGLKYTPIEFKELEGIPNCQFYLSGDVFKTFHNMVECDIFITGQGAFSLLAAYLSDGIKISIPWSVYWSNFPEQSDIITCAKNGEFSAQVLEKLYE